MGARTARVAAVTLALEMFAVATVHLSARRAQTTGDAMLLTFKRAPICSANPPSTQVGARQICGRPHRQGSHSPQATESDTRTRSPVSVRRPAVSCPKRHG